MCSLNPKYRKDMDKPKQAQQRATGLVRARVVTCEERLRDWDFFSLGKKALWGDLIAATSTYCGWKWPELTELWCLWWCIVKG